jgi:hypothetical protein
VDFVLAPTAVLPAAFTFVCVIGLLQAREEGRERRAKLFAIGLVIGVLLALWAWLSYQPG